MYSLYYDMNSNRKRVLCNCHLCDIQCTQVLSAPVPAEILNGQMLLAPTLDLYYGMSGRHLRSPQLYDLDFLNLYNRAGDIRNNLNLSENSYPPDGILCIQVLSAQM